MILDNQIEGGKAVRAGVDALAERVRRDDLCAQGRLDFLVARIIQADIAVARFAADLFNIMRNDTESERSDDSDGNFVVQERFEAVDKLVHEARRVARDASLQAQTIEKQLHSSDPSRMRVAQPSRSTSQACARRGVCCKLEAGQFKRQKKASPRSPSKEAQETICPVGEACPASNRPVASDRARTATMPHGLFEAR